MEERQTAIGGMNGALAAQEQRMGMQNAIKHAHVPQPVKQYIAELTSATRQLEAVYLGASPRGSLGLFRTGQALAGMRGRDYVLPDDVKELAAPVLGHRIIVGPAARLRNLTAAEVIAEV